MYRLQKQSSCNLHPSSSLRYRYMYPNPLHIPEPYLDRLFRELLWLHLCYRKEHLGSPCHERPFKTPLESVTISFVY